MGVTSTRARTARELALRLPSRLRMLSKLLARKPQTYTAEWASSIDESFRLYTNTRTINLLQSFDGLLISKGWPFPAYIDLKCHMNLIRREIALLGLMADLSNQVGLISRSRAALRVLAASVPWLLSFATQGPSVGFVALACGR